MLSKILKFVNKNQSDIILFIAIILVSLLSFALGYITAKKQEKESIKFYESPHHNEFCFFSCKANSYGNDEEYIIKLSSEQKHFQISKKSGNE